MSTPSTRIVPLLGSSSFSSVRPTVDLPHPLLADEPQRLARPDVERHAVDGTHLARDAREQAPDDRELLLEVPHLEQRPSPADPPLGAGSRNSCGDPVEMFIAAPAVARRASRPPSGRANAAPAAERGRGIGRSRSCIAARSCSPGGRCMSEGTMPLDLVQAGALRSRPGRLVQVRDRGEQPARVGVGRSLEQIVDARLPRPSCPHTSRSRGRRSPPPRPCRA